jgi:predicted metalloprotease with PDZ domain
MTETISYILRFPNLRQHLVEVEALFPTNGATVEHRQRRIHIKLPVWTPGSYLIREYARNIESIVASDADSGRPLSIEKTSKNRWSIDCDECSQVRVQYSLYCREASVRTNWVEDDYGFLTGAATFITLDDPLPRTHRLEIVSPASWPSIACSLPRIDDTLDESIQLSESDDSISHCFSRTARSFDELVDSPMLMGDLAVRRFEVSGKLHYLACYGTNGAWDLDQATYDCAKIVAAQHAFWGEVPYPSYWFINLAIESYGGLEHDNNTVLVTSHWAMRKRASYVEWLGLVSHEFFHTWNVRRLRPQNLVQYDYGAEQYIPELWIAEGVTSYLDDLLVLRAGLTTFEEYLGLLDKTIQQVEDAPGRLVQTLKDSSFDTWIKHYRPDENSINSRISYYTKGAVVAFLLDIHLRQLTEDRYSLGDVMRQLWQRHRNSGYTLADFEAIASELAGRNLTDWFEKHVHRSDPLDFQSALEWLGLKIDTVSSEATAIGKESKEQNEKNLKADPEWELGCETVYREGRIVVTRVVRGSRASEAGLQVDDELIAIGGHRLPKENWKERLQCYRDDQKLTATIARRGRLREIQLSLQQRVCKKLQSISEPSPLQLQRRQAWLFR